MWKRKRSLSPGAADPQLLSMFLAEGMDLIMDAGDVLSHWEQNPVPGDDLDKLRQELRILARSASAAQLNEVVELSMTLEELYEAAANGMITPDPVFFRTAHKAHESLVNMMDFVAAGQPVLADAVVISELQSLMDQAPEVTEQLDAASQHAESGQADEAEEAIDLGALAAPEADADEFEFSLEDASAETDNEFVLEDSEAEDSAESEAETEQADDLEFDFTAEDDAEQIKAKLEEAGATVEVK